jgi:hypothetical protein
VQSNTDELQDKRPDIDPDQGDLNFARAMGINSKHRALKE